tara:strand:- start:509 stop:1093 length:585 start_codon:yes stop_codon:yes gene_type:complete
MKKLIGLKKLRTAIFISGTGSNLKNLINFSLKQKSPIKIVLIISSNKGAKGLYFAKKYKIKSKTYKYINKIISEKKILKDLAKKQIQLVCLAGFMKVLSKNFIKIFNGKILNIHPSLLPKYKGLNTHKRVLANKDKFTGCTVHLVNSKLDSGKIILQKKIKVNKNDNIKSLGRKVLKQEHLLYPKAIKKLFTNF